MSVIPGKEQAKQVVVLEGPHDFEIDVEKATITVFHGLSDFDLTRLPDRGAPARITIEPAAPRNNELDSDVAV